MVRYKASVVLSNVFHCEAGRQLDSAILSFPIGTEVSKGTAARKMRMDVIEHEQQRVIGRIRFVVRHQRGLMVANKILVESAWWSHDARVYYALFRFVCSVFESNGRMQFGVVSLSELKLAVAAHSDDQHLIH